MKPAPSAATVARLPSLENTCKIRVFQPLRDRVGARSHANIAFAFAKTRNRLKTLMAQGFFAPPHGA